MKLINRLLGNREADNIYPEETFAATIIFECSLVLDNKKRVATAVEEFIGKFPDRIAAWPRVTQASDGNVIEVTMICDSKEELLNYNRELELIAYRYGLR